MDHWIWCLLALSFSGGSSWPGPLVPGLDQGTDRTDEQDKGPQSTKAHSPSTASCTISPPSRTIFAINIPQRSNSDAGDGGLVIWSSVGSGRAGPGIDRAGQGSIGQGIIRINARALGPDGRQGRAGQGLRPGLCNLILSRYILL
ncbi:hypothetical protein C8J56DRAFT_892250 [Mycena floridula]|nr:hypothetical protein C8J56DRAFT_892250 [Mycena floridula]